MTTNGQGSVRKSSGGKGGTRIHRKKSIAMSVETNEGTALRKGSTPTRSQFGAQPIQDDWKMENQDSDDNV